MVSCKASLRNFGSGVLELIDNTITFYIEKGYFKKFKKRKEIVREIRVTDIERIKRVENEFSITWKGVTEVTDIFVIEETELFRTIYEKITDALNEHRKILEEKEIAKQKRNELTKILSVTIEIVNSLFDVLRSLHGRVDWHRVENYLKRSEENAEGFKGQKIRTISLNFTKLSSAIKERMPEEVSKEIYGILTSLSEYFSELTSIKDKQLEPLHPNYHDAKSIFLAHCTLNDIILGAIVGDKEVGEEIGELVSMLEDLSKKADLKINVSAIKDVINKLGIEKESVIEESRSVFRLQLKELIA